METVVIAIFILGVLIIAALSPAPSSRYENKKKSTTTDSFLSMDEYVKQQEKIKIETQKQKDIEYLNSKIKIKIDEQDSEAVKAIFQTVLDLPDDTDEGFEYKKWLFNNGDLRTDKEIEDWNYQHGGFEEDLEKPKWYMLVWIAICLFIPLCFETDGFTSSRYMDGDFIFIGFFLLLLFTSFIPLTIYSCSTTSKLKKARKHGISSRDPKFIDASVKAGIAAVGAVSTVKAATKKK